MKIFDYYKNSPFVRTVFGRIWDHSLRTATAARRISEVEGQSIELCNVAFTSGLLHDIGKLILAANAEAEYRSAMEIAEKEGTPLHEAEQQTFGCTHAQLGAYLFTLWGFPDGVVRAVENHHKLEGIEAFTPALAIHVAQGLQRGAEHEKLLNMELLQALNLTEKIPVWQEAIANTET